MTYPPQQPGWNDNNSWPAGQEPYQSPEQVSGYPQQQYGYEQSQQPPYGYPNPQQQLQQQPYGGYGQPAVMFTRPTNGLAIASLICSLAGLFTCGVSSIVGAILGHVARRQIRERGDAGDGLALAGVISGWIITVLYIGVVVVWIVSFGLLAAATVNSPGFDPTFDPTPYST